MEAGCDKLGTSSYKQFTVAECCTPIGHTFRSFDAICTAPSEVSVLTFWD